MLTDHEPSRLPINWGELSDNFREDLEESWDRTTQQFNFLINNEEGMDFEVAERFVTGIMFRVFSEFLRKILNPPANVEELYLEPVRAVYVGADTAPERNEIADNIDISSKEKVGKSLLLLISQWREALHPSIIDSLLREGSPYYAQELKKGVPILLDEMENFATKQFLQ